MAISSAVYRSPCDGEYRPQGKEDLALFNSRTMDEAKPLSEHSGLETMATRLCPYGYEIVEDPIAEPRAGSTKPPLDETLWDLTRQLEVEGTVEVVDWKQHAAKQEKFLIALLTWALNMIDAAQSVPASLRDVLVRFAKAQDQVVALQNEREEAAGVRAALESRLHDTGILLKTAEDRSVALEKENQQMWKVFASIKHQVRRVARMKKRTPSTRPLDQDSTRMKPLETVGSGESHVQTARCTSSPLEHAQIEKDIVGILRKEHALRDVTAHQLRAEAERMI